jgi:hypothetical protein
LMSSGSKKEPRCACLIKAKASHRRRMWAEVLSSAPHFLHSGLSINPIKWRCLRRVLCLVSSRVTILDCTLLNEMVPRLGPDIINSRACLWELPIFCHRLLCWFPSQRPLLFPRSCLETPRADSGPTNPVTEPFRANSLAVSLPLTPTCPETYIYDLCQGPNNVPQHAEQIYRLTPPDIGGPMWTLF